MSDFNLKQPVPPVNICAEKAALERWSSIAKPLGSLGLLEDAVTQIAGITSDAKYSIDKRALLMLCADNGVVAQKVTQTDSSVTATLVRNAVCGRLTVSKMAKIASCDVITVDMGIEKELAADGLINCKIACGTGDISQGAAMTRAQAIRAIEHGICLVKSAKDKGYKILCTGEVGIGNTTTSSAVAAVLLGKEAEEVTGHGAGLSSDGLGRKISAIRQAIAVNSPDKEDAIDVLSKLGGFDIAGLCGVFIGAAINQIPAVLDGFISCVAALCAVRICPEARQAMLASHVSAEPAGALVLKELGCKPLITAQMRVGEGTGAVAALPLLDMAFAVYNEMPTFEDVSIEPYKPLK